MIIINILHIITCALLLPQLTFSLRTLTYAESNLFPVEFEITTDGTAVIRLQQRLPNSQCAESRIIMRYILPNGVLVSNDIDFKFDPINFCPVDKIEIHPLIGKFILVLYLNSTNPGSTGNNILVQYAAMIINQNGKVIQNNLPLLSPPFMSNTSVKTKTVSNSNGDFLWTFKLDNNDSITYAKFTLQKLNTAINDPTAPPIFTMSTSGIFHIPNNLNLQLQNYTTFSTFYGHFAIVFTAGYSTSTSTTSQLFVYCTFLIAETNNLINPLLIYNPTTSLSSLEIMKCGESSFEGTAFKCFLSTIQSISNSISRVQVSFLLTGFVTEITSIPIGNTSSNSIRTIFFDPLYFGGYLQRIYLNSNEIIGNIFDIKGNLKGNWDLSFTNLNFSNMIIKGGTNGIDGGVGVFRNNSVILVLGDGGNGVTWSVVTTDLVKIYTPNQSLINPNIASTSLPINTTVPLDTSTMSITFNKPISLSNGNISIFQFLSSINSSNNGVLLRQTFSGTSKFCSLDSSKTVITIPILQSTFNQPKAVYFIKIDDGFVRNEATDMALIGVVDGFWTVLTLDYDDSYSDTATALLKLSNDLFNTLATNSSQLLPQFLSQLSQITPVSLSRLSFPSNLKFTSINSTQNDLRIPIIIGTERSGEMRSARVISDLDVLIRNHDISPIGIMNLTAGIDKDFGVQWNSNVFQEYKFLLLGLLLGVVAILIIWYLVTRKQSDGNKYIILILMLILTDFTLDLLFIWFYGRDVSWLFNPSIILIFVPLSIYTTFSVLFILHEMSENPLFHDYYRRHTFLTLIIALFSCINSEFFHLLDSHLFTSNSDQNPKKKTIENMPGEWRYIEDENENKNIFKTLKWIFINLFKATYSERAIIWLWWMNVLGIFMQDIGQFVIQILYKQNTIVYYIIPLLTLITSSTIVAVKLIILIWHTAKYINYRRRRTYSISDEGMSINT
ncbi:hypothetical protein C2G38_2241218 [Gigaspora rosea]|uniref:SbsA Ig-like domain-containing protein n=1 Tax=Gigaspora rosea TaxID=44941 RepID=A0A397VVB7_9GLOM|nr:hypothetical protein C2G38_2241218 [Gigaspora rosea]